MNDNAVTQFAKEHGFARAIYRFTTEGINFYEATFTKNDNEMPPATGLPVFIAEKNGHVEYVDRKYTFIIMRHIRELKAHQA